MSNCGTKESDMSNYKGFVVQNSPEIRERIKKLWKVERWADEQTDLMHLDYLRVGPLDTVKTDSMWRSKGLGQMDTAYNGFPTLRAKNVTDEMILAALDQPIPEKAALEERPFRWVCRNTDGAFLKVGFNNTLAGYVDKIEEATLFDRRDEARGHWGSAVKVYITGFSLT